VRGSQEAHRRGGAQAGIGLFVGAVVIGAGRIGRRGRPALAIVDLLKDGYELYVPADACGNVSPEAHTRHGSLDAGLAGSIRDTSSLW
jgi:hypothetical protein